MINLYQVILTDDDGNRVLFIHARNRAEVRVRMADEVASGWTITEINEV